MAAIFYILLTGSWLVSLIGTIVGVFVFWLPLFFAVRYFAGRPASKPQLCKQLCIAFMLAVLPPIVFLGLRWLMGLGYIPLLD